MLAWDFFGVKTKKRKGATRSEREEIVLRQGSKCKECKTKFSVRIRPHIDHKDGDKTNKRMSNLQALCPNCHDHKSRKENQRRQKRKEEKDSVWDW